MFSNTKLQKAVRLALGLSAGTLAFGVSPGAVAQDAGRALVWHIDIK